MLILPPSAADDGKLFQCLNIVSDNKTGPIERGRMTSHYHGSKISGSQQ